MKKLLLSTTILVVISTSLFAQVFDSLSVISPGNEIQDLTVKGSTLYAAVGQGGVMYSADEGFTWTSCSPLPDAGFGEEWAYSIHTASNGDLIVGGNLVYNGAPLSGVVFRSSDDGTTWSVTNFEGLGGYEECGKIIELSDGNLMMMGGFQKLFISSLTDENWTQTNAPGGIIYGFDQINDLIFVVNNPAGGTAGTWTTTDIGATWQRYGSNGTPVGSGTVTKAPVIQSSNYKFIGIGGTYDPRGVYRSGINDTMWVEKNNGITEQGIYPLTMATDNHTIWMVMQNVAGTCMFTSTVDYGENWEQPVTGLPLEGGSDPCLEKMIVVGTDLYTYANESIYRKEDVAVPVSVNEIQMSKNEIAIYPNPSVSQISVRFSKPIEKGEWEIINLQGKVLSKGIMTDPSNASISINIESIYPGFYLFVLNTENEVMTQKFLKN